MQPTFEKNPRLSPSQREGLKHQTRPPWADVDLDLAVRGGVPMMHQPQPWPNTKYPPEPQQGTPAVPKHGRPNKPMTPVFGTSTPLKGLAGVVKKAAYSYPDHKPVHWLLMLLGDRVESWSYRAKKALPLLIPLGIAGYLGRRSLMGRRVFRFA